jgi:hypothetical protein
MHRTTPAQVSHFQGWINSTYSGTGVCVSEYNVANDTSDPAAATEEADYLGTFGLMGVRVASYWTRLAPNDSNVQARSQLRLQRVRDVGRD